MGSGKSATTTQQVTIPPEVLARYNAVNARAERVAEQPFQQYGGQFVAGINPTQQAGIGATYAASGAAQPYYNAAAGLTAAGSGAVNPEALQTQQYMSPYVENVVDATRRGLQQQQGQQLTQQQAEAIRNGAFGGDRAGIQRAVLQGQQSLATAQAIAPLYQQGYGQALQTAQQQQGVNLQAGQTNAQRALAAGAQFGQLGSGSQAAGLEGAKALMGAGTLEQQTQQADLTAKYQQFLQERGYPFQVAQFLANIAMGTGALSGSTTTTTQPASFFSDEREKTNIKPLGKGLYAYDYKDDVEAAEREGRPMGPKRVGPMAQDIEKKRPGLVVDINDYKVVDPSRDSMGGAVTGSGAYARGGYAPGGLIAPTDLDAILKSQQQFLGPYGGQGGPYGGQQQGKPGYVPNAALPVAKLTTAGSAPQQRPSGLAEAAQTGSQLAGLAKMGSDAFGAGKKWLESGKPDAGGATSASGGADGSSIGADNNMFDDVASYFRASGGLVPRHHYAVGGGSSNTAALPYNSGQDYFPEDILETQKIEPLKPADAPKQQGGGGLGDIISIGSKILPFFLSTGGLVPRHGYAQGGEPDLPAIDAQEAGLVPTFNIPAEYAPIIEQASRETGIPAALIAAQLKRESGFNPNARGKAGEQGIAQVLPSTARDPGFGVSPERGSLDDPRVAIPFQARYLKGRGEAAGVTDWNDPNDARRGVAAYNGTGPKAQQYANNVLALVRDDGRPGSAAPAKPEGLAGGERRFEDTRSPSRMGLSPRPGSLSETPENAPFRTLLGPMFGEGKNKSALTSENLWIPLLAGAGSMLASRSPYLGNAIGEGLVGGTKAYTDLQKQQAEVETGKAGIEQSGARTAQIEQQTLQSSLQTLRNGMAVVWTTKGPIPLGDYDDMKKAGNAPPLLGRVPRDADQVAAEKFPDAMTPKPGAQAPAGAQPPKPPGAAGAEQPKPPGAAGAEQPKPPGEPEAPQTSYVTPSGVYFDPQSEKTAREERSLVLNGGPDAERLKAISTDYTGRVVASGTAARDTSRFLTELAENLGNAAQGKMLNRPGFGFNGRAEIINALNTFSQAFGGPRFGDADEVKQINEKISALQAAAATKGVGQESYAALSMMKNAIANPSMSPRAFSKLAGDLLVQNQRMIDRYNHYEAYTKASQSGAGKAQSDFERLHPDAKYTKEADAIAKLIVQAPDLIKDLRSGVYSQKEIDDIFKKAYKLEGMSRYFVGGR